VLPGTESLKTTLARVQPYWEDRIAAELKRGRNVLVAAHGNSLRAVVKMLENISDDEITELNIPTGIPRLYELDTDLRPTRAEYLGDAAAIAAVQRMFGPALAVRGQALYASLSYGLGGVAGTVYLASRRNVRGLVAVIVYAIFGAGTALALVPWSHRLWLALALLVIIGVVLTATRTLQRGRLSDPEAVRDTLEPKGSGRRLSVKADLPGIALQYFLHSSS